MKKIWLLITVSLVILIQGCSTTQNADTIRVIVPNGSTSIAQAFIEYHHKDSNDYDVFRVAGPEPLVAAFATDEFDFIIAPITLGAKLINAGANYTFLATITEGNLFLASGSTIESIEDLGGRTIIAFGQNNTPDIVLRRILSENNLLSLLTIEYVSNTQAALAELIRDPDNIVLISEPFLSMASNQINDLSIIDLNQVWQEQLELPAFPQAGVFVRNDVSEVKIEKYKNLLSESIQFANTYPVELAELTTILDYPFPATIISSSIERSGLVYRESTEAKVSIEAYFEVILGFNAELIGKLPDDSFYYGLGDS